MLEMELCINNKINNGNKFLAQVPLNIVRSYTAASADLAAQAAALAAATGSPLAERMRTASEEMRALAEAAEADAALRAAHDLDQVANTIEAEAHATALLTATVA